MSKVLLRKTRQASALTLIVGAVLLGFFAFTNPSQSAAPTNGSLNPTGPTVTWAGTSAGGASLDETTCTAATCDSYTLTLTGTPADWAGKKAQVSISWTNANNDFDVFVHKGSVSGPLVASSANGGGGPEVVELDPSIGTIGTGTFVVRVVYFLVVPTQQYAGKAEVIAGAAPTPTPTPGSTPTPTPVPPGTARFHTFPAPSGVAEDAGEPSIGSNWRSENVVRPGSGHTFANSNGPIPNGGTTTYYGGFLPSMLRITFDDCSSPANDFWEQKPLVLAATPRALGDPILFTDHVAGRTWVMQEEAQAGATTDITDDDGETFSPSTGSGPPAGVDHETQASGPYRTTPPTALWPPTGAKRAVYYAAQSVSDARISRSDDGGVTYGPAIPMYTTADCGGLHGHVKVTQSTPATLANGHSGTVYVPNNACGGTSDPVGHADGQQAAIVSEDNGLTWAIRKIPNSDTKSDRDPSIGIATDGTIYLGMQAKDGHARVAVSHDKGITWSTPFDVGAQLGINNIVFPAVVAGDGDQLGLNKGRAAFAFFGTTTAGDNYDAPEFPGVWYLYVALTYDSGQTWTTINVTPNDPVQRGGICGSGTCRNLLDFFDATIDKEGRVLIGWEDGCIGGCVNGGANSFTAKATISRQSGGKRMYAAFDPVEPAIPQAPAVTGNATPTAINLTWKEPDNGGLPIVGYNVYRRAGASGPFVLIATVNTPSYTDTTFNNAVQNYYHVTALNQQGEGPYCKDFLPSSGPVQTACVFPGIKVNDDTTTAGTDDDSGQNTPADPRVNIKQLFVAEPFVDATTQKLFFTLQVAPSTAGSAPPNSQWIIIWNRQGTQTSDPNDSKYDRLYLAMVTDANGAPTFEYGKFGIPINTSPPPLPDPSANSPAKFGVPDSGSYNPLTGEIKISISNSKLQAIDGGATKYVPGTGLAGVNVRTYFNRPDYISDPNAGGPLAAFAE